MFQSSFPIYQPFTQGRFRQFKRSGLSIHMHCRRIFFYWYWKYYSWGAFSRHSISHILLFAKLFNIEWASKYFDIEILLHNLPCFRAHTNWYSFRKLSYLFSKHIYIYCSLKICWLVLYYEMINKCDISKILNLMLTAPAPAPTHSAWYTFFVTKIPNTRYMYDMLNYKCVKTIFNVFLYLPIFYQCLGNGLNSNHLLIKHSRGFAADDNC